MVTAHRFGSWSERAHSHHMIWGQLIKAQTLLKLDGRGVGVAMDRIEVRVERGDPGEHGSDPPHASGRPVRGLLSIERLIRHHKVLEPSPNPRGGTLS
jgi:hypothetical protein